jgi:hypothetical protein
MQKAPISVRIINVLSIISFWILIVVTSISFIGNIILETGLIDEEFGLKIALPVTFDVVETGATKIGAHHGDIRIEDATGQMYLPKTPIQFTKSLMRLLFAVLLIALFMAWKFKMFIANIKEGLIFESTNINNLKHIAYGILILFLITKVYEEVLYYTMVRYVEFESIIIGRERTERSDMIIAALLLWIVAHIFMKGVEMKEDQELTI